ncbi:MAG: LAGLIDADG family homing endonuclease [Candidatus Kerfeldbacteria bacterium]|nr:LAGLIDADG family homing endonuclease [Candidatus Kerfeldbacteria bacterium]
MASNNVLSADNQQERLRLKPWYIVGFVDGEGSFHIALYQDDRMKTHLKIIPEFHVSQNATSRSVLEELQYFFKCGNIKTNHRGKNNDQTEVYVVRERQALVHNIIPFFEKYSLRTSKANDFKIFAQIVRMMIDGEHQTRAGCKRIIQLAFAMNARGKYRKVTVNDLIKIVESSETIREN